MKKILLAACFAVFSLSANPQGKPQVVNTSLTGHAHQLNLVMKQELIQLDALSCVLQYMMQILNKGIIATDHKNEVKNWIAYHQKEIKRLAKELELLGKNDDTPLNIPNLGYYAYVNQQFFIHVLDTIDEQFETMLEYVTPTKEFYKTQSEIALHTISKIQAHLKENDALIKELRRAANQLGLTTLNLVVRAIDDLNNQYKITQYGSLALGVAGLAASLAYTVDEEDMKDILPTSCMGAYKSIKSWVGPRPEFEDDKKTVKNKNDLGKLGRIEAFFESKSTRKIAALIGTGAIWWFKENVLEWGRYQRTINSKFRRWWSRLKGYSINKENSQYRVLEDMTLDDERLVGLESQKEILRDMARYILDPEIFDRTGSSPAKCMLLTGPAGSGKTLLAKALSGTINAGMEAQGKGNKFGFKEVSWSDVMNWGEHGLSMIIDEAKQNAPCVIFIDEIHNLPLQISANGGNKVLSSFLKAMNELNTETDANNQVILLAATNRPDLLDPALLRSGRFGDMIIKCQKPNFEHRKKFFEIMLKRNSIDCEGINLDDLAEQTEGVTFSTLDSIITNACFKARTQTESVKAHHLQQRVDEYIYRINSNKTLTAHENGVLAAHLAGKVLFHMLDETKTHHIFKYATTYGRWPKVEERRVWTNGDTQPVNLDKDTQLKYGKICTYNPHEHAQLCSQEDLLKLARIELAGKVAEITLLGSSSAVSTLKSRKKAYGYIKKYVLDGLEEDDLSKEHRKEVTAEVNMLLKQLEQEAVVIIKENKLALEKIAEKLKSSYTISNQEAKMLVQEASSVKN